MTDLVYVVNRVSMNPREVDVTFNGETMRAMVSEMEVEMYDPTSQHGFLTIRFTNKSDVADAAKFVGGATVTISLDAFVVEPPAAPEA